MFSHGFNGFTNLEIYTEEDEQTGIKYPSPPSMVHIFGGDLYDEDEAAN